MIDVDLKRLAEAADFVPNDDDFWPSHVLRLLAEKGGAIKEIHEVEQRLGKALGYPWYKDDPKNFPDATEADGVCVGEHAPGTIAHEAANRIDSLAAENARLLERIAALETWQSIAKLYRDEHRRNYPGGCFSTFGDERFSNKYDHRCGLCKRIDELLAADDARMEKP